MRVDFSPIARAGQAQARANQAFGDAIGGAIEKYAQNKKEGEAADMQIGAILQNMTPERQQEITSGESELGKSLSKFVDGELSNSKKKALLGSLMTVNTADQLKRKEQMDAQRFQQQQELTKLNMQIAKQNLARQESVDQLVEEERNKAQTQAQIYDQFLGSREMVDMPIGGGETNHLMKNVPPPTIQVPQGEYKGNRFLQTEQGKSDFTSLRDAGMDASDALEIASKREAQFLANQPKPMTPKELADLEAVLLSNKDKQLKLNNLTNPKPTANLAYTDATINAISDAESLLEKGGLPVTGFWGNMLKDIAGTGAADLKNSIVTIKSAIGFDKLQDMRDKSPTGGALGQVSERELAQLNASLGSLEQSQSAEQFRKNLIRVKDHYQKYYKATMAQVKAYEQGLKFDTEKEAMSWYDQNFPIAGKPTSDNQTNITTPGGFSIRKN